MALLWSVQESESRGAWPSTSLAGYFINESGYLYYVFDSSTDDVHSLKLWRKRFKPIITYLVSIFESMHVCLFSFLESCILSTLNEQYWMFMLMNYFSIIIVEQIKRKSNKLLDLHIYDLCLSISNPHASTWSGTQWVSLGRWSASKWNNTSRPWSSTTYFTSNKNVYIWVFSNLSLCLILKSIY